LKRSSSHTLPLQAGCAAGQLAAESIQVSSGEHTAVKAAVHAPLLAQNEHWQSK
jgi:hypothetical protein